MARLVAGPGPWHGAWVASAKAWQCLLLPLGTVFRHRDQKEWVVSLGPVCLSGVPVWPLSAHSNGCLTLSASAPPGLLWEHCLELEDLEVLPAKAVSLAHSRFLQPRHASALSVAFCPDGLPSRAVLHHAALHCFWQVPKEALLQICALCGLPRDFPSEVGLLNKLLLHILPDFAADQVLEILSLRGKVSAELTAEDLPHEALEDLVPAEEKRDIQDLQGRPALNSLI